MTESSAALEPMLHHQQTAWNAGDGVTWSAAFTDDADFVNILGDVFHGREAIARQHVFILTGPYKGSRATITIRSLTLPAPTIALIETDYKVTQFRVLPPGMQATSPGVLKTRMKYVAAKQDDQWRFIAAQNTVVHSEFLLPR
jgi:uncharacterized protein (TIGR02246 family)